MGIVEQYLLQLKIEKRRWRRAAVVLTALSLLVAIGVSWNLRITGITLVNNACCGYEEHLHTEQCLVQSIICAYKDEEPPAAQEELSAAEPEATAGEAPEGAAEDLSASAADSAPEAAEPPHVHVAECYQSEYICGHEEHLHSLACYSDPKADVETPLDWQNMFEAYPYTGNLRADLVGIAKTQVGYTESALNFEADSNEVRHGYTRYGAWYGAPYSEWSAMFVSFCLHYARADLNEYPINSGANTMAGLWDGLGRYAPAEAYSPAAGDLVFFKNNTVGIVAEVQSSTIYVISGDMQDAVSGSIIPIGDSLISGWGMIDKPSPQEPIVDGEAPQTTASVALPTDNPAAGEPTEESRAFAMAGGAARSSGSLADYLAISGGTYYYTLTNTENDNLDPDGDNHYIVTANEGYKLVISIVSPNKIESGAYTLQLPGGLLYDGGTGNIVIKNGPDESLWVPIGTWEVTGDGLITIVFNEEMDSLKEHILNATIGIHFPDANAFIDFEGKMTVTVQPTPEQQHPTTMLKGGHQGQEANAEDPSKIYWSIQIVGDKDSQIVGNTLSDSIVVGAWSKEHHYTASDIAGGLHFGVWENNKWHDWDVSPNDPNLTWTDSGWSYRIPETAVCDYYGEIQLGNEGWTYNISYTSTPDYISLAGKYGYENIAGIDGKTDHGWADFTQGDSYGVIDKSGSFVSDAGSGNFVWEIQATIPGRAADKKADYYWYLMDYLYRYDENYQNRASVHNDANLAEVTAKGKGAAVRVPELSEATSSDKFAWVLTWSPTDGNGVEYGREIALLSRCNCNKNNCQFWSGNHCGGMFWGSNEYCHCWTAEEDTKITFVYKTAALPLIEEYGGKGHRLQNIAELYYKPDPSSYGSQADNAVAEQLIPDVFTKRLIDPFNGYTAHYQITVNESKLALTNGTPLTVKDTMSNTLAYISGSLVIKSEDAAGNISVLRQGEHYTVAYDGSGSEAHLLEITLLAPQPVKYTIDYDTTVLKPDTITGAVMYSNSASITLWGGKLNSEAGEKIADKFNSATRSCSLKLHKLCALTRQPLEGAVFGIYNEQGGLIAEGETDKDGYLLIETNLEEGIVLSEHKLYYAQEHTPPASYMPDYTEHWFIFCSSSGESCDMCSASMGDKNALRIPPGQTGNMDIVNHPISYELPATGGIGLAIYILCGLGLISAPLVYGLSLRRKYERRLQE